MKVLFCGVRGSTPAPGAEFTRTGGHTSCVAVAHDGGRWCLVLDAGTGIRDLTAHLHGQSFEGTVLLSHLHWDHVQGLPFFAAGDRDDTRARLLLPDPANTASRESAYALLARAMSPPHFPIRPDELRGDWTFEYVTSGAHHIEGFDVVAAEVPHKGGRTFGFRVSDGTGSMAYVPDHHPAAEASPDVESLVGDVDLLVHDAQFLTHERAVANAYGHATVEDALDLAAASRVRTLALFHHAPGRTDDEVDAIGRSAGKGSVDVVVARQGTILSIDGVARVEA